MVQITHLTQEIDTASNTAVSVPILPAMWLLLPGLHKRALLGVAAPLLRISFNEQSKEESKILGV